MEISDRRLERAVGKYTNREELVSACRDLASQGMSHRNIAPIVKVSSATVSRLLLESKANYSLSQQALQAREAEKRSTVLTQAYRLWRPVNFAGILDIE
jgi:DNA-directed RNA polymerase specialized sigma subunit